MNREANHRLSDLLKYDFGPIRWSLLLGWVSIGIAIFSWCLIVLVDFKGRTLSKYAPKTVAYIRQITENITGFLEPGTVLLMLIAIPFLGLVLGILAIKHSKEEPYRIRVLGFIGTSLNVGYFLIFILWVLASLAAVRSWAPHG